MKRLGAELFFCCHSLSTLQKRNASSIKRSWPRH